MKNLVVSAAVVAALCGASVSAQAAQSAGGVAEIREQLQDLARRVERLERENETLRVENEQLRTRERRPDAQSLEQTNGAAPADQTGKASGAGWTDKIVLKGDLRYRYEMISDETATSAGVQPADRYRDRIRARINVEAKATDDILVGIGAATTEGGDPRSSNQSLDGTFSRKSLDLDLAYFDWTFADGWRLISGKMKQPFIKPGQSLFWDNDVNPEGLAVAFERGAWFASGYNYWIDEVSGASSALTADAQLAGFQIGVRAPLGSATLVLGAHYYDLSAGQGRRGIFFNCNTTSDACANGNTTIGPAGAGVLAYDFQVAELFAELNTSLGSLPLQAWADAAENQDPQDLNFAWAAGVRLGAASKPGSWDLAATYQSVEKDALFAQLIDSDFGGGVTDAEGLLLRAGYAPVKNTLINAAYFINTLNVDAANMAGARDVDYDRFQLDFNVKF